MIIDPELTDHEQIVLRKAMVRPWQTSRECEYGRAAESLARRGLVTLTHYNGSTYLVTLKETEVG